MKRHAVTLMGLCFILASCLSAGCTNNEQQAMQMREDKRPDHIKAIWVTRMDYTTEEDVRTIIRNSHKLGMNTVIFQVRGNGTVFYPSKIEPWAEQFDFKNPGYDPLQVAIEEARKKGMRIEAYVNVMPAWRGPGNPKIKNQLYFTHPEWFWYDKDGNRQSVHHKVGERERDWYVSINPCLPEVRDYIVSVFKEIAQNYDIDGLHLDYIRFPSEPVVAGEVIPDYPRDKKTLALYKEDTGLTPDQDKQKWIDWRADQVTQLVRDIRTMLNKTRPTADLTASVGHNPNRHKQEYFQDSITWRNEGLLDVYYAMNYARNPKDFKAAMEYWKNPPEGAIVVQGIGAFLLDAPVMVPMLEESWNQDGNFCLFAYSSLYPTSEDPTQGPTPEVQQARAERRDVLRNFLQGVTVAEME